MGNELPMSVTSYFLPNPYSEANLKEFAAMAISGGDGHGSGVGGDSPLACHTLPLLYVSLYGYREITAELAQWRVLPRDSTSHAHWTMCLPKMIEVLIASLYPAGA